MTTGSGRAEYRDTEGIYFFSVDRKVRHLKCLVLVQIHLWANPHFVLRKHSLNQNMAECGISTIVFQYELLDPLV